jgi:HK97 family phage major capsid protein
MNLAERIVAAETALVTTKDSLTVAVTALEAAPNEESLLAQVEELTLSVEKQATTIGALRNAEKALALRAAPAGNEGSAGGAPAIITNLKSLRAAPKGGELLWKHATAKLLAHVERKPVEQVLEERYGNDQRVKASFDFTTKTAVPLADTTTAGWAAELVREDMRGFIESLTEVSVAASLASSTENFTFDGAGSISIPTENPLAANPTEPAWVGEGGVIPLTSFGFGSTKLQPHKLAAITTMSKEITQRSTPAIEAIVQNLLRKAYAKVLDHALLTPAFAAVAGIRPASLYNGVTPTAAGAGAPDENIRADILALLSKHTAAGLGVRPVLIGNNQNFLSAGMMVNALGDFLYRDELNGGRLLGISRIASGHVPLNQLGMVDAAYIAMAMGAIEFDVSEVATVTEANADAVAPTQAMDAAGALGTAGEVPPDKGIHIHGSTGAATTGYTARSLWQTYSLGIRMVAQVSWGKLNPAAAQYIAAVKWA